MKALLFSLLLCFIIEKAAAQDTLETGYLLERSVDSLDWNNIPKGFLLNKTASYQDLDNFRGLEGDTNAGDYNTWRGLYETMYRACKPRFI